MSRAHLVVVDPGHGGVDPGAVGPGGVREAYVVLDVALALMRELNGARAAVSGDYVSCLITRRVDASLSLRERVAHATDVGADLFVSIHANAGPPAAEGFEIWTSPGQTAADPCATEVWEAWGRRFPGRRRRLDTTDGDPDKEARFYVLTRTRCPSILVELGFVTNPREEQELVSPEHQRAAAEALAEGIRRYLLGPDLTMLRHRETAAALAASATSGLPPPRTCNMPEEDQSRIERLLLLLGRWINRRKE